MTVSREHMVALRAAVKALEKQPRTGDPECFYCHAPATLLCDGEVARIKMEESPEEWDVIDTDRPDWLVTCDRPLCTEHASYGGAMHFCGDGGCDTESVDYCPECGPTRVSPLVSEEEALSLQARRLLRATDGYENLADYAAPLRDLLNNLKP